MNRIVWVMGESAAGKATFIRFAVANPNSELARRLLGTHEKMIPVEESMYLGDYERIAIKDIVLDLLNKEADAVILIKWQATDSLHPQYGNVLRKLAAETPDTPNEILLLSVESDALYARLPNKPWWNDPNIPHSYFTHEQLDRNLARLKSHAKDLSQLGFALTEIDATDGYRVIGDPPSPGAAAGEK